MIRREEKEKKQGDKDKRIRMRGDKKQGKIKRTEQKEEEKAVEDKKEGIGKR